ncbi:hypothetical protein [Phaeobacter gallaeciensis]|uniref:Outer membrane autotransporter n=2 Tax=Phaeobacter gallaeciensis TaxID=60890 RepID=A0AAC9ZD20_9RHOB|nr:hypothetical protein [Phaeobacter gallaeciensis]AHD11856.1 hypothetical protein Gal_04148 [Phaeobacter gallaeciensis DSM 26640]ATE95119.1 outer membrane autotransporter [Phaeobacter gallaeciensis]ATE99427.1 outer membrane autotransporter [Phaeobacter gallaeciensis]ATF03824.1 outer membrane autotransporter [Phaeobacter gallaeciensis]ATF08017.1 outer membrane autotransporter [Phaeobacter gallaeciensis]
MQKTMITAATVFALVISAGASMAGPLNGHGFSGKAHDVRVSASQALNNADRGANTGSRNAGIVGAADTTQGIIQFYSVDTIADAVAVAQMIAPNAKATYNADHGFGQDQNNLTSSEPLGTDIFTINFENHSGGQDGIPVIFWSPK